MMRPQHFVFFGLDGISAPEPQSGFGVGDILSFALQASAVVFEAIGSGYRAAPALMLGMAMLPLVPLTLLLSRMFGWAVKSREVTQIYRKGRLLQRAVAANGVAVSAPGQSSAAQFPPGHAFLELVGPTAPAAAPAGFTPARFAILRDMLRIGREEDNDIRISSRAVHRYHAAIHREDVGSYRITDLSGFQGNGVVVNGRRCDEAELHDGDLIELGPGRLRFHAGLV